MLVVIGIIILLIGIAIPAIRALTGNRNSGAAYNELSAVIGQARQDAMALQNYHGVLFYIDPKTDRVYAAFVQPAVLPSGTVTSAQVVLDTTPNREFMAMPNGVGLETINDSFAYTTTSNQSGLGKYLGYNPPASNSTNQTIKYGGLILFDGTGQLVTRTCAFACTLLGYSPGSTVTNTPANLSPSPYPQSCFGFVLFDRDALMNQSGVTTEGDVGWGDSNASANNESAKDTWLDSNSTPVLINRYNGTLLKGE
jgi:type II secretory pathway pseudopilin PulG